MYSRLRYNVVMDGLSLWTRPRAKAEFEQWKDRQGGLTFDSSAIIIRTVKAVYLCLLYTSDAADEL